MYNITMIVKYKILPFLFVCIALVSCIDDDLAVCIDDADEIPEMFTDGFSLNMVVTLDQMGGTRGVEYTSERGKELQRLESYIDPEKFRVLFFDRQERFLFESKSRWVKKIVPSETENDYSEWFVAVPIYAYGNDETENWNWDEIRRVLTGEDMQEDLDNYPNKKDPNYKYNYDEEVIKKVSGGQELQYAFKIAILANRPKKEWNMGINGRKGSNDMLWPEGHPNAGDPSAPLVPQGWDIVNGPSWNSEHTRWGKDEDKIKTVFDLHHCQYDPIYDGKNYNDREENQEEPATGTERIDYVKGSNPDGEPRFYTNYKVYSFAADKVKLGEGFDDNVGQPAMGATSTWVDWSNRDGKDDENASKGINNVRYFVPPSEDHPIPMYGMQNFNKIDNWVKGTPFNLSKITSEQNDYEYRTISLLRSVVKLELVLKDKEEAEWVALVYPNIYARCEPMNVWDPTDAIWNESTDNEPHSSKYEPKEDDDYCEWYNIRKYGAVTRNSDFEWHNTDYDDEEIIEGSIKCYQERMSWFYGAWSEPGPDGKARWDKLLLSGACVSQNGQELPPYPKIFNSCVQRVGQALCHDGTRHTRPYGLLTFPENDGQHYVVYTGERNINDPSNIMSMGTYTKGAPTICFWQVKVGATRYNIAFAYKEEQKGDYKSYITDTGDKPGSSTLGSGTDPRPAPQGNNRPNSYEQAVQFGTGAMPWPLLRNHVYKITVNNASATRSDGDGGLSIESEHLYSKSINFDKARKEKAAKEKIINKEAVTEAIK